MRLNIISDTSDRELDAIRAKVQSYTAVTDVTGIAGVLRARTAARDTIDTIDIVGHSSEGVLLLGATPLDDSPVVAIEFTDVLRPLLLQLGVRELRFLGCATATSERGRAVLRRISLAARCDVLGTRRYIGRNDYGPSGFMSDEALVGVRALAAFTRSHSGIRAPGS